MTEKLFYQDSYIKEFEADVLECTETSEGCRAVLDKTAFFPEGGGQYADNGWINGIRVMDARENGGIIYHILEGPLTPGERVHGKLDWEERFERMQQHTGEHIVSGIVHARFGYENVGFHLGSDYCTMDFNGPITREELREIELEANRAVYQNLEIGISYPSRETLKTMEYRSKIEIEGQVRIVNVPGYDVCACCAPHVKRTGEIGMIKLVDMMNYKGGERITMLAGFRALKDYGVKEKNTKAISSLLCVKENEVAEAVSHLKQETVSLKGSIGSLQRKILTYQAAEIPIEDGLTIVFDSELAGNAPRELMNLLLDRGASSCAVFAGNDADGYRYVIGSRREDVRPYSKKLNAAFSGRGGGKPEMVQGSLVGTEAAIRGSIF